MEVKITIFEKVNKPDKPYYITVDKAVHRIKSGKSGGIVSDLRKTDNAKEKQEFKKRLPAICFSGEFKHRSDKGLLKHSGLVCIDFDHLGDRLMAFKDRVCKDPYTHIAFISPSGDGLKVIIKIPPQVDTHAASCRAISKYYKDESLDEFEDVSRVCFESYDPTIYYNKDSDIFIKIIEEKTEKKAEYIDRIDEDVDVFERVEKWYNDKGEVYSDGNKHKFLVKMAAAANWIGMDSGTTSRMLAYKYRTAATPIPASDIVKIVNDVFRLYKNNHGRAVLESGKFVVKETKKIVERELLEFAIEDRDVIKLDDVRDSMINSFLSGRTQGASTHFINIDNHFRWKRGELTLMHGIMNHGKSIMLMQMCLLRSVFNSEKWAFFSPEQNPPDDFYDDLVHMYIGQNTQKFYANQMSLDEYKRGMDFIKDHFYYIYPESESPTPDYINVRFQEVVNKYKVDGCVIDPYNQLDNDIRTAGGREDLYLSTFLTKQKRFALNNGIYMVIVAHPRGSLNKNGQGDYEMPNVYDLSGGAMWGNKCDNVLCTYRPFYTSDKNNATTVFASQKIKKQKLNGVPGDITLKFDIRHMRYYEQLNERDGYSFNPLKI